jgi:DNA-binding GntR family transcriptional regulator
MSQGSLRQQAYDYIQRKILSGDLPAGSQVSELSLAQEIGISRTPVREAIRQLASEGIVVQVPRFGTIVRTPERREFVELFQLREALEPYAVYLAAQSIRDEDLTLLEKSCDAIRQIAVQMRDEKKPALDPAMMQRFLAADMSLHMLLIRAAGNRRIAKIVADSRAIARIFGAGRQEHTLQVVASAYRQHCRIVRALRRRDGEAARSWMADHIRRSMRETLEHYDRTHAAGSQQRRIATVVAEDVWDAIDRMVDLPGQSEPET